MKKLIWWVTLLALAIVIRVLPSGGFGLGWTVDKYTTRDISLNILAFWAILIIVAILLFAEIIKRIRAGVSS
jgi:uncharacterized protein HemY